uniref:cGMP-dependent protein kinase n=1 Tax=Zooxanthella nutricula TaxID=1333877 RepID=A0A7S2IES4_9DINO
MASSMAARLKRKASFLQGLHKSPVAMGRRNTIVGISGEDSPHAVANSPFRGSIAVDSDGRRPKWARQPSSEGQQFKEGDRVVCLELSTGGPAPSAAKRLFSGIATVVKPPRWRGLGRKGAVEVELDTGERVGVEPELLRPHVDAQVIGQLGRGDSFGELSLLYNTRREATFRAREASTVFVIGQDRIRTLLSRRGPRFEEDVALLDEVQSLSGLSCAERRELARSRMGHVTFVPGEVILTQGHVRQACLWYVIDLGSVEISRDGELQGCLQRAGVFGERSLVNQAGNDRILAEVGAVAGPRGAECLTFAGELVWSLLERLFAGDDSDPPMNRVDSLQSSIVAGKSRNVRCELRFDQLRRVTHLGRGGFGSVVLMEEVGSNVRYALKVMSKGLIKDAEMQHQVCWERDILLMLDSPFIIHLFRTYKDAQFVYFLLEAATGGNLFSVLHSHPELFNTPSKHVNVAFYVACIIFGLEHIHERRIVYRDLKPENVLLDGRGYGKLCDMGFARFVLGKTNTLAGTPEYMAPEIIAFPHAHDQNVDWWSLGVLTFELVAGQTPFEDDGIADPQEKLIAIHRSQKRGAIRYPPSCPSHVKNFISRLLRPVGQRLGQEGGAAAVKGHPWFNDVNFIKVYRKEPQPVFPNFPPIDVAKTPDQNFASEFTKMPMPSQLENFGSAVVGDQTIAGFSKVDQF